MILKKKLIILFRLCSKLKTVLLISLIDYTFYYVVITILGAFLVTYFVAMIFCGIPIFFQEVAIGQYLGSGGMTLVGKLCPILSGKIINNYIVLLTFFYATTVLFLI